MTNRSSVLMLLAIAVVGIYVLPSVTARFAGSHSMELNQTGRISSLQCERCHDYILGELGATSQATDVLTAHRLAAPEANYVNGSGILNITKTDALANANRSACMLCHLVTRNVTGNLNMTHTHTTIRVCDDDQCHGAGVEQAGDTTVGGVLAAWATDALNVSAKLSNAADPHSKFYNPLNVQPAYEYIDQQTGQNYTKGFYACMACHTHVGVSFNLSRPNAIGFNMTATFDGSEMSGFEWESAFDPGTRNVTVALRQPGSVWE